MTQLYTIADPEAYTLLAAQLDQRQQALLGGAINYHSLVNPGTNLEYYVYLGVGEDYPRLTDTSTLTGTWAPQAQPLGTLAVHSQVRGKARPDAAFDASTGEYLPETGRRYLRLPAAAAPGATPHTQRPPRNWLDKNPTGMAARAREMLTRAQELDLRRRRERNDGRSFFGTPSDRRRFDFRLVRPTPPPPGAEKAILFGLPWLQAGGAERWALETIQIAKDSGFTPIVITDQPSYHQWATRPELVGCLLLPLTMPVQRWHGDEPLLRFIAETFDLRAVFIHHCTWLYTRLPWIKKYLPQLPVVDSLHIIDLDKGGYPSTSVTFDDYVDIHQVISPQLQQWLVDAQGVYEDKIVLAPLVGLTTDELAAFQPRVSPNTFTIAYVGALAPQKRPDVFLNTAESLHDTYPDLRFIMHGEGELSPFVDQQIAKRGLGNVIERRAEETPVSQTLADSDALLMTSSNEGLALPVLEAIAAGIPAISTHVGSQETLIPEDALLPRSAARLIRQATPLIGALKDDEDTRQDLWEREREALEQLAALTTAGEWTSEWMRGLHH